MWTQNGRHSDGARAMLRSVNALTAKRRNVMKKSIERPAFTDDALFLGWPTHLRALAYAVSSWIGVLAAAFFLAQSIR